MQIKQSHTSLKKSTLTFYLLTTMPKVRCMLLPYTVIQRWSKTQCNWRKRWQALSMLSSKHKTSIFILLQVNNENWKLKKLKWKHHLCFFFCVCMCQLDVPSCHDQQEVTVAAHNSQCKVCHKFMLLCLLHLAAFFYLQNTDQVYFFPKFYEALKHWNILFLGALTLEY